MAAIVVVPPLPESKIPIFTIILYNKVYDIESFSKNRIEKRTTCGDNF